MTTQTLLLPPEPHHRVSRDRARELFAKMRATIAAMTDPAEAERIGADISGNLRSDDKPVVFASDCPPCDCCGEPFCELHGMHYADCACLGPDSE